MSFSNMSLDLLECDSSFSPHQAGSNRASTKKIMVGEGAVSTQDMIKKAKIIFKPSQEDQSIVSSSSRSTDLSTDKEVNNGVSNIPVPPSFSQPLAQSTVDLEWPAVTPGHRTEHSPLPYSTTSLLELEWKDQMERSIEMQDVTDRLGVAKCSVRGLELQVGEAVDRKKDLEEHCKRVEEILRPCLLVMKHKMERGERFEVDLMKECLARHPWGEVFGVLKHQVKEVKQERGKLVRLLDSLRRTVTVLDKERIKDVMDLVRSLVRRLGASEISWEAMEGWEKEAVRLVVVWIQGIPEFVCVMLDQLLVDKREVGV